MLHRMTIKVIHVYQLETLYYLCYWVKCQPWIIWGHRGQKVIFTKKASSPREYVPLTCDLCICINLTPSTKVITLKKNHPGSFGVRSFSLKNSISCPCCKAWPWNSYMCISLKPSTYIMGSGAKLESFGVTGNKRSFSLKMLWLVHVTQNDHKTNTCKSAWDPLLLMLFDQMSIWAHLGHRGQKVIFTKNAITRPFYIEWP